MVVIADVNGDGRVDLVVGNGDGQAVSLLFGNGDGTFQVHVEITAGVTPFAVAVGDFNNDHKPDLAVTSVGNASVSILPGNGDGTFQTPIVSPPGSGSAYGQFAVSDFDGDSILDIATASFHSPTLSVLLGKGDGTIQSPRVITLPQPANPQSLITSDLDGDGRVDLIVGNSFSDNAPLRVLFGNGDGTFPRPCRTRRAPMPSPSRSSTPMRTESRTSRWLAAPSRS